MPGECSICGREGRTTRGWCGAHYQRFLRHGDPLVGDEVRIIGDDEARFWSYVEKGEGCWEWQGGRLPKGYGRFGFGDKRDEYAHRYSLMLKLGRELQPGEQANHHCDNPPCVRPDHLYLGDATTNIRDAVRRGRHYTPRSNAKKTHCPQGHPYSEENTRWYCNSRKCIACDRKRKREYYRRDREQSGHELGTPKTESAENGVLHGGGDRI